MTSPTSFRLQSCMGCIPLQRATVIIGFLALFASLLEISKCILLMVDTELSVKQCQREEKLLAKPSSDDDGMLENKAEVADNDDFDDVSKRCPNGTKIYMVRFARAMRAVTFFIYFILTALMIHGAKTGKPNLMAPWLWWQLVQITFTILAIFGLFANVDNFVSDIFTIIVVIYFFLVVNSHYLQLRESAVHSADLRVVAVAHPRMGMTVTIPSPRKDDPPPPYPGFTPGYNSPYNHAVLTSVPSQNNNPTPPPPYPGNSPYQSAQASQPIPENQELYASALHDPTSNSGGEAAPLVEKNPLPQN